jgi:hypothetical protein
VTNFYVNLVAQASAQTATYAMKTVAKEIEKDGLDVGTADAYQINFSASSSCPKMAFL